MSLTQKSRIALIKRSNFLGYKILSKTITDNERVELHELRKILDKDRIEKSSQTFQNVFINGTKPYSER